MQKVYTNKYKYFDLNNKLFETHTTNMLSFTRNFLIIFGKYK